MTRSFFAKVASAAAVVTFAAVPTAQAQGQFVSFTGFAQISDPDTRPNQGNTLLIDFLTNTAGVLTPGTARGTVDVGSNNLGLTAGTTGTIADLTATPTGFQGVPTIGNFVNIGAFTFSLASTTVAPVQGVGTGAQANQGGFGPISLTQVGTSVFAGFVVNGTVTGGTFGTAGQAFTGSFTTQFNNTSISQLISSIDNGTIQPSDFSARFDISQNVIPEPSTYALMASGVAMLGAFARRRRQQA